MAKKNYQVVAEATTDIEYAKITLEGQAVYLRPNSSKTKFTSEEREIEVDGKLHIFFKCKGFTDTKVKLTITHVKSNKKILDEKKITIGKSPEPKRIGKYDDNIDPE